MAYTRSEFVPLNPISLQLYVLLGLEQLITKLEDDRTSKGIDKDKPIYGEELGFSARGSYANLQKTLISIIEHNLDNCPKDIRRAVEQQRVN